MDSDNHKSIYITKKEIPRRVFREEYEENKCSAKIPGNPWNSLMAQGKRESIVTREPMYLWPTGFSLAF